MIMTVADCLGYAVPKCDIAGVVARLDDGWPYSMQQQYSLMDTRG